MTAAPAFAAAIAADSPAGPPPTTSTSHAMILGLRAGGIAAEWRQLRRRLAGDHHAVGHLRHAGTLADAAVHRHHAVEAGAHAAMQSAWRASGGAAIGDDAGGRQRRGDRLALQGRERRAVELECDGAADGPDRRVGEAHRSGSNRSLEQDKGTPRHAVELGVLPPTVPISRGDPPARPARFGPIGLARRSHEKRQRDSSAQRRSGGSYGWRANPSRTGDLGMAAPSRDPFQPRRCRHV